MRKYWNRITKSARGEIFNPLLWPFLLSTFAYGVGFTFLYKVSTTSALFDVMYDINPLIPIAWGIVALATIVGGLTFLLFNVPPYGKISGILGFMLWLFAAICFGMAEQWLLIAAFAIPNMWFWIWQYLSLARFRTQDREDDKELAEQTA